MDLPAHVGDLTTALIQNKLDGTHLEPSTTRQKVVAALYSGTNYIQLTLTFEASGKEAIILRRVDDLYVNVNQLFQVLIDFDLVTEQQRENFIADEIIDNPQYHGDGINQYLDLRNDANEHVQGVWISYDKAVAFSVKFDIYQLVKRLFLIDVHEFDRLPNANKRVVDDDDENGPESPTKRQRSDSGPSLFEEPQLQEERDMEKLLKKLVAANTNTPYAQSPVNQTNDELALRLKLKFGEIFKEDVEDGGQLSFESIKRQFDPIIAEYASQDPGQIMDIALDPKGQTALHFAATLASKNLVRSFIKLGVNLPVRGNIAGETPLILTIQVTNLMEKGNFGELLRKYLWPGLWLFNRKHQTVFHHLAMHSRKAELTKYYTTKIIEYIALDDQRLRDCLALINVQDEENGDTALHWAVEQELKWMVRLLLVLKSDATITNKKGVKPQDFKMVQAIQNEDGQLEYVFDLLTTAMELLDKRLSDSKKLPEIEDPVEVNAKRDEEVNEEPRQSALAKIFKLILDLLANTNVEYEQILNTKREQIKALNQLLHDLTIVTANNRYMLKLLTSRLLELDNLKLQLNNLNDKLAVLKTQGKLLGDDESDKTDEDAEFSADAPFIIPELYEPMKRGDPIEDIKPNDIKLPPLPILKARIAAYKEVNLQLESELQQLMDYSELTTKFKKVVLMCTGVGINEVDDLLDGLLEAVESQQ
ncbi:ankyrin repeat domain-containing protein [Kocuria palustris]|nr:ankyrin repeat domain-containing protein [Kocuria palustris]